MELGRKVCEASELNAEDGERIAFRTFEGLSRKAIGCLELRRIGSAEAVRKPWVFRLSRAAKLSDCNREAAEEEVWNVTDAVEVRISARTLEALLKTVQSEAQKLIGQGTII